MSNDEMRAKFETWNRENFGSIDLSRHDNGEYRYARTRNDWDLWQAAIALNHSESPESSAPVASGLTAQVDGREAFEAWATSIGLIAESHGIRSVNSQCDVAFSAWQAALSARQPVAAAVKDCLTVGGGQPVGHEPVTDAGRTVAYDAIDRFLRNNMDDATYARYVEHLEALWAAVPAQAVDLAENILSVLIEEGVLARNGRVFQKLRALIDSSAAVE